MVSTSNSSTGEHFQFISIQSPDDAKNKTTRRLAQSHAVKRALRIKRMVQQESGDNFRVTTSEDHNNARRSVCIGTLDRSFCSGLDPFQTLPVDSSRLQILLGNYKARQAPEPVFSVAKELSFQNFFAVFRTGLADPALLNAVMLSFVFSATGGSINRECLGYQGQAITYIRMKMSSLVEATSESTIGAILLLAGVEARLGQKTQVQIHMNAVQQLLEICRAKGVHLTSGIKRAIFWQDLNSSILAGSSRIFDHSTFAELQWTRDPFCPNPPQLPPGFQMRFDILTKEFVEVLEDLHALQCIRDIPGYSHISSQLLCEIQQTIDDPIWDDHPDLLLWLLYIGGTFAPKGTVHSDFVALLRSNNAARFGDFNRSWPELLEILKQFIWSEKAFTSQGKLLWEETFVQRIQYTKSGSVDYINRWPPSLRKSRKGIVNLIIMRQWAGYLNGASRRKVVTACYIPPTEQGENTN
ncbi:hypothetical protein V500_11570 [Pseudogymnoascus sp. VKM F-4518 (FW-2643)]|nr:hypothetical protein V500_11570 [Pseudogymnoascus sp. VKM F-4518 (FW-2643)]